MGQMENDTKNTNEKYSANTWVPVVTGMIGLVLSVFLLTGWPFNNTSRFQEIDLGFRRADSMSLSAMKSMQEIAKKKEEDKLEAFMKLVDPKNPSTKDKDSTLILNRIDSISKKILKLDTRLYMTGFSQSDSQLLNVKKLSLHPDTLAEIITCRTALDTVVFSFQDAEYLKFPIKIENRISSKSYPTNMAFFQKYPAFAYWLFLGIFQMVLWMLVSPAAIFSYQKIGELNLNIEKKSSLRKSFILSGLGLGVFCLVLYLGIIDKYVIQDKHFMRGFECRLAVYAVFGYITAWLCLAGYLYLANTLYQIKFDYNKVTYELQKKRKEEITLAANDEAKLAAIENIPGVRSLKETSDDMAEKYKQAKTFYNLFLAMSALVLSVLILWVASIFQALNSLEISRYYKAITGNNFFSNDFVYLYGALHSILLAIFVLPARFWIMDMNASFPDVPAPGSSGTTANNLIKNLGKTFTDLLVVSSPLIASFFQELIKSFFN